MSVECYNCGYVLEAEHSLICNTILVFCSDRCYTEYSGCDHDEEQYDEN